MITPTNDLIVCVPPPARAPKPLPNPADRSPRVLHVLARLPAGRPYPRRLHHGGGEEAQLLPEHCPASACPAPRGHPQRSQHRADPPAHRPQPRDGVLQQQGRTRGPAGGTSSRPPTPAPSLPEGSAHLYPAAGAARLTPPQSSPEGSYRKHLPDQP